MSFWVLASGFAAAQNAPATAKNVILLIGDGMGLTQITAAMYAQEKPLHMQRCSVTGLITTHAARDLITDSAAGATAFACGCKTRNGYIGLNAQQKPCETLLEKAKATGKATGIVVTSSLTHATPASFVAHVPDRSNVEAIAPFFVEKLVDLLVGGGQSHFDHRTTDTRNLLLEMQQKGYRFIQETSLPVLEADRPSVWFTAPEEPAAVTQGRIYLPAATRQAPLFLQKRSTQGFFLLVEGSQIDWAGHANDAGRMIAETLDFDEAVGAALDFAQADGQTLVVVTADHETGGLALAQSEDAQHPDPIFINKAHTASFVPVFAFGPGAAAFHGLYDNTAIYTKIRAALGW